MIRRIQGGDERHAGKPVRTILVVLPPLVEDDVALVLELGLGERGEEVAHAIGFHPQRQLHGVGRHDLPVVRPVGVGRSVEDAAGLLQRPKVPGVVVLRSLEHQVLEQVRESRAARLLVLRADVVPHVDRDDRTIVILVHDHVEAVVGRVWWTKGMFIRPMHGPMHEVSRNSSCSHRVCVWPALVRTSNQSRHRIVPSMPRLMLSLVATGLFLGMTLWFSATAAAPAIAAEFAFTRAGMPWLTMAVQGGFVAGTLVSALLNLADVDQRAAAVRARLRRGRDRQRGYSLCAIRAVVVVAARRPPAWRSRSSTRRASRLPRDGSSSAAAPRSASSSAR